MQITELNVGHFGVWQDFQLALDTGRINVIYGPNEAGKTTLMRFVGEMMYGFDVTSKPIDGFSSGGGTAWNGTLKGIQNGDTYEVTRVADLQNPGGRVIVSGGPVDQTGEQQLAILLGDVDPVVFNHVFSIGLHQLQQLATLTDTEAARFLFDLTLGAEGQQLLQASARASRDLRQLWDSGNESGRLFDQILEREDCLERLRKHSEQRGRYTEVKRVLSSTELRIDDIKSRQAGLRSQLHGHQFLEAAWRPWNRIKEFETELNMLDASPEFSQCGLERLEQIDREFSDAESCRDAARETAAAIQVELDHRSDRKLTEQYAVMQAWVQDRDWVRWVQASVDNAHDEQAELTQDLQQHLSELGEGWTRERLQQVDTHPALGRRVLAAEQTYRAAVARCRRLRRRCRRLDTNCQTTESELQNELTDLGCSSVDRGLEQNAQLLAELQDIFQLKLRCHELRHARETVRERIRVLNERTQLPRWLHRVMQGFAVVGLALVVWGLISGVWISGLAGAAYLFLGVTWLGIQRGLKQHVCGALSETVNPLREDVMRLDVAGRNAEAALAALLRRAQSGASASRPGHVPMADWTTEREQDCLKNVALDRIHLETLSARQSQLVKDQDQLA
ncbi:MAG: AAA family ATPase, partial [Planctomycetaceae bacterium]